MKKYTTFLATALLLGSQTVFATVNVACNLGSTCFIPIDGQGNVQQVNFTLPTPYTDPVGKYICTFKSSDPSVQMGISASISIDGDAPNFPYVTENPHQPFTQNMVMLPNNQSVSFSVVWGNPGQPHPHILDIYLNTQNQSGTLDPKTQLSITCSSTN